VYSGLTLGKAHDHSKLDEALKAYLDNLLKNRPIPADWLTKFETILDDHLGKVPDTFIVGEKQYTPRTFARDVLQFRASDYVALTSFTHHPFYQPFILEVPDNFSNGVYYNLPLNELLGVTRQAVANGYSIMWDADVSNPFFRQKEGIAMQLKDDKNLPKVFSPDDEEIVYDEEMRQRLFENLATQDDHLMHLVGVERSKSGKTFYLVKNSWGEVGPYKGFIHVSEAYFAINTISLVMPKAALDKLILMKLGL
jgi:bleomycin hydrolase